MLLSVRIGDRLGSYRIVRSLGEGGMGVVFEAVHEQIGRRAAAKILTLDARRNPSVYQRFINEARAATQIDHPGVVQVFEFGQLEDGTPWMLMELLQGHTLAAYLRAARKVHGAPLGTDGLWIFHDLAAVLARAHRKGIVHRDLKPSNVMIVEETGHGERVKLLDFGIAKFLSESLGEAAAGVHHTRTGALLGTPAYMAPEQCKSSIRIDGQADVYALGVMLYELYTAQQPFFDAEPLALMMKKLVDAVPPILSLAPAAPPEVADLTMAMLEREPSQRPTMTEVQSRLAAFLRIPAVRRSGFLPHVTPPDRPAAQPQPAQEEPALPATESGPMVMPGAPPPSALPAEPPRPPLEERPVRLQGPPRACSQALCFRQRRQSTLRDSLRARPCRWASSLPSLNGRSRGRCAPGWCWRVRACSRQRPSSCGLGPKSQSFLRSRRAPSAERPLYLHPLPHPGRFMLRSLIWRLLLTNCQRQCSQSRRLRSPHPPSTGPRPSSRPGRALPAPYPLQRVCQAR